MGLIIKTYTECGHITSIVSSQTPTGQLLLGHDRLRMTFAKPCHHCECGGERDKPEFDRLDNLQTFYARAQEMNAGEILEPEWARLERGSASLYTFLLSCVRRMGALSYLGQAIAAVRSQIMMRQSEEDILLEFIDRTRSLYLECTDLAVWSAIGLPYAMDLWRFIRTLNGEPTSNIEWDAVRLNFSRYGVPLQIGHIGEYSAFSARY